MTISQLKVKVQRKAVVKLKVITKFPSAVSVASPILLDRTGGNFAFSLNMTEIVDTIVPLFQEFEIVHQEITDNTVTTVNATTTAVSVNKTIGSATTLTLPLAATKIRAVLIADWKGDAGTNNIIINPSGSEKIQGLSSWTIAADNGSVSLTPIPGAGYLI